MIWVSFASQMSSVDIFNYFNSTDNWNAIIKQLKANHTIFPLETRAILIDDALNLARVNMLSYEITFDLLSYLMDDFGDEVTLHPWLSALKNLNFLYVMMEELANFSKVETFIRNIVNAVYNKINDLKYNRVLSEDDEEKRLWVRTNLRNLL